MTCPTVLTHSRYADAALPADEAAALEQHLADCVTCHASVEGFVAENQALRTAMHLADAEVGIPAFVPRPTISRVLSWFAWTALALWAINMAWVGLVNTAAAPPWLGWLAPNVVGLGIELVRSLTPYMVGDSGGATAAIMVSVRWIALVAIGLAGLGLLVRRRAGQVASLCLPLGLVSLLVVAPEGHAFELRRDDVRVTIPAEEVVDDTLIVASENVMVEGTVTGDLIAVGESVTVRGRVEGNLFTAAETLNVEGDIAGSVLGAGETVNYRGAALGANLYTAGETVTVHSDVIITGSAAVVGEEVEVQSSVGRDLTMAGAQASLLGSVGRHFRAYAERVDLADSAEVGGDMTVKVASADHLQVADGATVTGETNLTTWPEEPNRYTTFEFYLGVILKLLAALMTGVVLFYLFPGLRSTRLDSGGEVLTIAAFGALALIATPVLAFVVTITLIGAPLGIVTFLLWLVALYLGGIVAADHLGRLLLDTDSHRPVVPLLLGLVILYVLVSVPILGGPVRLVATIVGLGLIAGWLRNLWQARVTA